MSLVIHNSLYKGPISKALGSSYSGLEEGKADVMGVYNILYMIKRGELSEELREKSLVTYVAGLFRSIRCMSILSFIECLMSPLRFGVAESHGRGAALQLNTFLEDGAVSYNSSSGKYEVRQLPGHQSSE